MHISKVPRLARGPFSYPELKKLLSFSKHADQPAEGIYLRFDQGNWLGQRAKIVRPAFLQSVEQHWSRSAIRPNRLTDRDGGWKLPATHSAVIEKQKMKQIKPFVGKWRIAEMEVWGQGYVDMEVPGYIRINSGGTGRFQFGLVSGDMDGRVEQCGDSTRFEFSWSGQDENDSACGRGWAVIKNSELCGRIYLHLADDSAFLATKDK